MTEIEEIVEDERRDYPDLVIEGSGYLGGVPVLVYTTKSQVEGGRWLHQRRIASRGREGGFSHIHESWWT